MKTVMLTVILIGLNCGLSRTGCAQSAQLKPTVPDFKTLPPKVSELYKQANENFKEKKFDQAFDNLKAAQDQARQSPAGEKFVPPHELEAGAILRQAQVLMLGGKPDGLTESLRLFEQVGKSDKLGSQRQRATAQMNAATVLMRLKRPEEAAQRMYDADWSQIDRSQKHVLYFNYGRALEDSGQPLDAVKRYARSLANVSTYQPAAQRLQSVALQLATDDPKQIFPVGKALLDENAAASAADFATTILLKDSFKSDEHLYAVRVLLQAWRHNYVNSTRFEDDYSTVLGRLADSTWAPLITEVRLATAGDLVSMMNDFKWCSSFERKIIRADFASFLAATAQPFLSANVNLEAVVTPADEKQVEQAFARIYIAWRLNPQDFELCQQLAWLTHSHRNEVDKDGRIRDQLIRSMIEAKSNLYRLEGKNVEEWESILRMHTSLAQIFEADKKWGSEETVASSIAQWTYAINAEKKIRELQPEAGYRAPGLHERLAGCLIWKQRKVEAFNHFLEAGKGYLARENISQSQQVVMEAGKLESSSEITQEQKARLQQLRAEIQAATAARPTE